jgi:hypothetical protein
MAVGDPRADYATPLYSQNVALTSPISGCRSVGIVRSGTQAMEFVLFVFYVMQIILYMFFFSFM